jgi:hypothetical protein
MKQLNLFDYEIPSLPETICVYVWERPLAWCLAKDISSFTEAPEGEPSRCMQFSGSEFDSWTEVKRFMNQIIG